MCSSRDAAAGQCAISTEKLLRSVQACSGVESFALAVCVTRLSWIFTQQMTWCVCHVTSALTEQSSSCCTSANSCQ
jgi:hypothetical protein